VECGLKDEISSSGGCEGVGRVGVVFE
jgi:hypothetical protein